MKPTFLFTFRSRYSSWRYTLSSMLFLLIVVLPIYVAYSLIRSIAFSKLQEISTDHFFYKLWLSTIYHGSISYKEKWYYEKVKFQNFQSVPATSLPWPLCSGWCSSTFSGNLATRSRFYRQSMVIFPALRIFQNLF